MGYWQNLAHNFLARYGITPTPEDLAPLKSMTLLEAAALFLELYQLEGDPEALVTEMEGLIADNYRYDIPLKEGVAEYLERLSRTGVKMCIATATGEALAWSCLERLEVAKYFDFLLSGEVLQLSKKTPELYLMATKQLGSIPEDTAIFEDALFAAQTAKEAGFYTVAVWDNQKPSQWTALTELADLVITDWRTV